MPIPGFEETIYPRSLVEHAGNSYFLYRSPQYGGKQLGVIGAVEGFAGTTNDQGVLCCPCSPENAAALRRRLPWLQASTLGLQLSFGFGDRLGTATPGHIRSLQATGAAAQIAPIFAQQSVRENQRTGRTPQQVFDDAMWGVFQDGWRAPWGADADHVKEERDLLAFVRAGYTFYTIDPSDHVDNAAHTDSLDTLRQKVAALPWDQLGTSYAALRQQYCGSPIALDGLTLHFEELQLLRALAKYGRALAHTIVIGAALAAEARGSAYELELSVDETDTPTSVHEHYFIANELRKRDLPVVSLAPRFVGKFQKGVDYIGDLGEFEAELINHVAIMRHFDSYKLSIHTGSDKFSIYPIIARHAGHRVHVKTAGTSYLEALRVVAARDRGLFREILDYARARFNVDRKTYYLDAVLEKVPASQGLTDAQLAALLDQFDARQVLHVTFGSILDRYGAALNQCLAAQGEEYEVGLERHFARHLEPFVQQR